MDRMKTFLKYAIWGILLFVFSDFMINVAINSSYKKIEGTSDSDISSIVEITEAEATLVNGKMRGKIKYNEELKLEGNYLRIDFLSKRDNIVGTKYIPIEVNKDNLIQDFNVYFELQDVKKYKTSIVKEKEVDEIDFIPEEMKKREIVFLTIFTVLMIW